MGKYLNETEQAQYGCRLKSKLTWLGGAMLIELKTNLPELKDACDKADASRVRNWHEFNSTERYYRKLDARVAGYAWWSWIPDSVFNEVESALSEAKPRVKTSVSKASRLKKAKVKAESHLTYLQEKDYAVIAL